MPQYAPKKGILCPPFGYADIAPYAALMNAPEVQMMKHRSQLSLVREVYLTATHTRLAHSLGVMRLTNVMLGSMFRRDFFADEDREALRRDLCMAALVHDIGHPPFSHATEYVLGQLGSTRNHKDRTVDIITGPLAKRIAECGSTSARIVELLDKKNGDPRGAIVTSKSIGADKIGYLYQDQHQTGYNASMPKDWKEVMSYLCFAHNQMCVEEKKENFLQNLQRFYFEMWTHVYLRKQAVAYGRLLQKGIELHLRETGIPAEKVWGWKEGQLEYALERSENEVAAKLYQRVAERNGLKAAVVYKIDGYERSERKANKPMTVRASEKATLMKFLTEYSNPLQLTELETRIAKELGLHEADIVVAIVPEPGKLVPEDVTLVDAAGKIVGTLFDRSPRLLESLKEQADEFFAVRVMVDESERERVAGAASTITGIIDDHSLIKL